MKFKMHVGEVGTDKTWFEDYDENCDDAQKKAERIIAYFNSTLRPGESPRKLLNVEVINKLNDHHLWTKLTFGMSSKWRRSVIDYYHCNRCGITGKLFGLDSFIKRDSKFKAKKYADCKWWIKNE